jgi:hypothetical protein
MSSIRLELLQDPNDRKDLELKLTHLCEISLLTKPAQHGTKPQYRVVKAAKGVIATNESSVSSKWKHVATFCADYKFWRSLQELQDHLNKVYLLVMTESSESEMSRTNAVEVASDIILRKKDIGIFERIGRLTIYRLHDCHQPDERYWYRVGTLQTIVIV